MLSARKRFAFVVIALALPFLLLGALELSLRAGDYGGTSPLFEAPPAFGGRYLAPGEHVGSRFFPSEQFPPTPPNDLFLADKPAHGLRIFALGESSAAGFPYPPNAMFTRLVADALGDAIPGDTVEVVNLGIAATNSYALVDFVDEILEQKPDAILIYSGHNEYYGALGVGSTESLGAFPAFVRLYLRLQRLKTFLLLRNAIKGALSLASNQSRSDESSPSRMESVARDQRIDFGGTAYRAGSRQYETNLAIVLEKFRDAGVPVFIGSLVSNLRDQRPLALLSGGGPIARPAQTAFDSASQHLDRGDSITAKTLFERARDLDVVRFRAPGEFNSIVKRLAEKYSAHYVPVAETFAAYSRSGIPGGDLILEHVHPNSHGYALLGAAYVTAIKNSGVLKNADFARLRSWSDYAQRMSLTEFDERIALHEVQTVTTRWPFVPFSGQKDYRGTYKPANKMDSLAFFVSRGGITWTEAKSQLAEFYLQSGKIDEAVKEYDGLIRNFPHSEPPLSLAAKALLSARQLDRAIPYLERAISVHPTGYNTFALGVIALRKRDAARAIGLLEQSLRIAPRNPDAMYQLSLAYAFAKNAEAAQSTALKLYQLAPGYPGLSGWLATLGLQPQ
ncbi:MAG: tetratricopeptide repeat protein [Gemmatimonadaceae bacterium]|nr:tetratricopeptide repeat protein [Gemmatimonadaceae bacterium]